MEALIATKSNKKAVKPGAKPIYPQYDVITKSRSGGKYISFRPDDKPPAIKRL